MAASPKTQHATTKNPDNWKKIDLEKERKKKAQEEKREAKRAQIAAGKELPSKLFSASSASTCRNLLDESDDDSAEESALQRAQKEIESLKAQLRQKEDKKKVWNYKNSFCQLHRGSESILPWHMNSNSAGPALLSCFTLS